MKIEDNRRIMKPFMDVDKGEVFMYKGVLYMRTERIFDDVDRLCNAVVIDNGLPLPFTENMMVESVDAKLVIE